MKQQDPYAELEEMEAALHMESSNYNPSPATISNYNSSPATSEWIEAYDEEGNLYYYSSITGEIQKMWLRKMYETQIVRDYQHG
eukprot:g105.t1